MSFGLWHSAQLLYRICARSLLNVTSFLPGPPALLPGPPALLPGPPALFTRPLALSPGPPALFTGPLARVAGETTKQRAARHPNTTVIKIARFIFPPAFGSEFKLQLASSSVLQPKG